jgi:hypothetical protein
MRHIVGAQDMRKSDPGGMDRLGGPEAPMVESEERAAERRAAEDRREMRDAAMRVRAADMQPYVGLRYVATLFRIMAVVLAVLLLAEMITGLRLHGAEALMLLIFEGGRLMVLAGLLWGSADLALLMIDVGHDVRATRILIGRQAAHGPAEQQDGSASPET